MPINVRTKGQTGEQEVCKMLNSVIYTLLKELNYPENERMNALNCIQRNQNQSAVGGSDLTNTFGLAIEIKRQEALSVNSWWAQCVAAAERNNEIPVLMYRQNRKPWRVRTYMWLYIADGLRQEVVGEMDEADFCEWFRSWVKYKILNGHTIRN